MELNRLAMDIHQNAIRKGFYKTAPEVGTMLMLIVSELAEALEADRSGRYADLKEFDNPLQRTPRTGHDPFEDRFREHVKDTFEDEIADAVIRLLDLAAYLKIDIERHVGLKMLYNASRPHKHGKKY